VSGRDADVGCGGGITTAAGTEALSFPRKAAGVVTGTPASFSSFFASCTAAATLRSNLS